MALTLTPEKVVSKAKRPAQSVINTIIVLVKEVSSRFNIPSHIISGIVEQESNFDTTAYRWNYDRPADRSYGLMQLTLPTAQWMANELYGKEKVFITPEILYDPKTNLTLGTFYIRKLLDKHGNLYDAIASYNAGKPIMSRKTGSYINLDYVKGVIAKAGKYVVPVGIPVGLILLTVAGYYIFKKYVWK